MAKRRRQKKTFIFKGALEQDILERRDGLVRRDTLFDAERFAKRELWKRDLTNRTNGTIDPYYQCDLYDEMIDYALNFSLPWSELFPSARWTIQC